MILFVLKCAISGKGGMFSGSNTDGSFTTAVSNVLFVHAFPWNCLDFTRFCILLMELASAEVRFRTRLINNVHQRSYISGPATWKNLYPIASGQNQSPIDIRSSRAVYDVSLTANLLNFKYEVEKDIEIANTGHSVEADIKQLSGKYMTSPDPNSSFQCGTM